MPLTVITLKKVPASLRGDLTKWMQEIATGVYVGNFNRQIREELWERVIQNTSTGEATMSFSYRNEIGYQFETHRTQRKVVNYDGIPLVMLERLDMSNGNYDYDYQKGFSNVSKFRKAKVYASKSKQVVEDGPNYVVIDIETSGLDYNKHSIIELGAVKLNQGEVTYFNRLIEYDKELPEDITDLTGITQALLNSDGVSLIDGLKEIVEFIGDFDIVGYGVDFDLRFLNKALKDFSMMRISNQVFDLMRYVKKEKKLLDNYKLDAVLIAYDIDAQVPHRALEDAKLIFKLSTEVNNFLRKLNQK